jgi:hypothetical protein
VAKTNLSRSPRRPVVTRGPAPVPQASKAAPEPEEFMDAPQEESANAYQVAVQNSAPLTSTQVLSLQQTVGNQAVGHLLQRSSPEVQSAASVKEAGGHVAGFGQPVFGSPVVQTKKKKKKTPSKHKVKSEKKTGETSKTTDTKKTDSTKPKETDIIGIDDPIPHTDAGEAYCCDVGKSKRSPTEAKKIYDAKAAPHPKMMNLEETGKMPNGADGPKNWIKCELADEIEGDLREMLKAASADGAELNATIGLRSLEGQWRVWHNAGHPESHSFVASPGTSNHGTGRAIDFHAGFPWLLENAGRHGFVNLTTERWHYDHVSTPGIIEHHRKMINNSTKRKKFMGEKNAKALTADEKVALTKQYDEATAKYEALPYNQARAFPRETWLKIQEAIGMPEKQRTGTADEATSLALILWQRSVKLSPDGKVTPKVLKVLQKESTIVAGWSGTVDKSINAGLTVQGKGVRRIPFEGLSTVKATTPEDPAQGKKAEFVLGRALALVPANVTGTEDVEVLVHLHGHTAGYKTAVEKTTFGASVGHTEDLENDKIVQQLEGSGRKMIALLPQGTEKSDFDPDSGAFDSDAFINEMLLGIASVLKWPKAPSVSRSVLSGFSGGGLTVNKMGGGKKQPKAPSKMGELILFDALHGDQGSVWNLLEGKLNADLQAISGKAEAAQLKYIREKGFRFRGITTGKSGYGKRYQFLADKLYSKGGKKKEPGWFPTHASDLGGEGSNVYQALAENYQVIISANTWHGTLMGDTKEAGVKGYLEQALAAGPPQ